MEQVQRRSITRRNVLLGLGAIAGGALVDGFLIEPGWMEITRRWLPVPGLPPAMHGLKIVHVADFHLGNPQPFSFLRGAVEQASALDPDLLIFTGDFVHHGPRLVEEDLIRMLEPARARLGVFGVLGNHDSSWKPERISDPIAARTPVRLMEGRSEIIEDGGARLQLLGLTDDWTLKAREIKEVGAKSDPDLPRILLQHNPDLAEELQDRGEGAFLPPHVQLSGHTHGGQVILPGVSRLPSRYGWKFARGLVQGASHPVFVTRGIGGHSVLGRVPRFLCRPEISVLRLFDPSATLPGSDAEGIPRLRPEGQFS
jgi:predicted MPP superfamily phosphohydrolase